jgi:ABC-type transporter Mla subunit MlaD
MYEKHAELKAGVVVLAALAALLALLWIATGADPLWEETKDVHLRFEPGSAAPKEGDELRMNGVAIGRVVEVEEREERRRGAALTAEDRAALKLKPGEDGLARELYVFVTARVPKPQRIPEGTTAEISVSLTGQRRLDLVPGRSPVDLEDTARRPIPAAQAGDLAGLLRSVDRLVDRVAGVADRAGGALDEVRDIVASLRRKIDAVELERIQGNVLDATGSLKETMASLRSGVETIGAQVAAAVADVRTVAADGKTIVAGAGEDLDAVLESLKAVAAELRRIVERTGPKVDVALDDLARAGRSLAAFGADAERVGPQVRALLGEAGADVDRLLARLAEVGQNLQDASEDLRAHPWKLLNKPDAAEIAYENLRTAAASYVRAASRVQETTQDLAALLARKDLPEGESKRLLQEVWTRLRADEQKYAAAEAWFQRVLAERAPGVPPPPARPPGR